MLLAKYFSLNLSESIPEKNITTLRDIFLLNVLLLLHGMTFSVLKLSYGLRNEKVAEKHKIWLFSGLAVIVLCYVVMIFFPGKSDSFTPLYLVLGFAIANFVFLDFKFPIGMIRYANKNPEKREAKISKAFGYMYGLRYIVIFSIYLIQGIIFWWDIPESIQPFFAFAILLYFNLVPFIWLKYYFLEYAGSMLKIIEDKSVLDTIYEKYNISKREQEILKLILDGKSNKDIEDILFISYHTVKNHVYNIFQKFGIKTRYELIHLVTKFQNED